MSRSSLREWLARFDEEAEALRARAPDAEPDEIEYARAVLLGAAEEEGGDAQHSAEEVRVLLEEQDVSEGIVTALSRAGGLLHVVVSDEGSKSASPGKFRAGDAVVALLAADQAYHDATVERSVEPSERTVRVRFLEFGHTEACAIENVVHKDAIVPDDVDDDFADEGSKFSMTGPCEMCGLPLRLTFHHLIPKETHGKILKRGVAREATIVPLLPQPQMAGAELRAWLNTHGINICGQCHRKVHQTLPNEELARKLNTLELVLAHEDIKRYLAWKRKQKTTR